MSYKQAFKDHSYLWLIGPADFMTGVYVDQEDLNNLLATPTKKTAEECLTRQIRYWFLVGPDLPGERGSADFHFLNDQRVADIADRYAVYSF